MTKEPNSFDFENPHIGRTSLSNTWPSRETNTDTPIEPGTPCAWNNWNQPRPDPVKLPPAPNKRGVVFGKRDL